MLWRVSLRERLWFIQKQCVVKIMLSCNSKLGCHFTEPKFQHYNYLFQYMPPLYDYITTPRHFNCQRFKSENPPEFNSTDIS